MFNTPCHIALHSVALHHFACITSHHITATSHHSNIISHQSQFQFQIHLFLFGLYMSKKAFKKILLVSSKP